MQFTDLTDDQLIQHLKELRVKERAGLVKLLSCLGEIDSRRVYLKYACSSLFAYCTRYLRMSEDEAYRRIGVARLARRFPDLLVRIERGTIHLTAIMMLREHLTEASYEELIGLGSEKSKDALKRLVAARFPTGDVRSEIRQLPTTQSINKPLVMATSLVSPTLPAVQTGQAVQTTSTASTGATPTMTLQKPHAQCKVESAIPAVREAEDDTRFVLSIPITSSSRSVSTVEPKIEPLSATRHKVQFTASTELREKIERTLRLMSHRNPKGDLAEMFEDAVDLLLAKLDKTRLGKLARSTTQRNANANTIDAQNHEMQTIHAQHKVVESKVAESKVTESKVLKGEAQKSEAQKNEAQKNEAQKNEVSSARIPRAVRREVFARDGEQCTFVSEDGERCSSRSFLEIDHRHPRALGGKGNLENTRLLCAPHNRYFAERVFGREYIQSRIRTRQTRRSTLVDPSHLSK